MEEHLVKNHGYNRNAKYNTGGDFDAHIEDLYIKWSTVISMIFDKCLSVIHPTFI